MGPVRGPLDGLAQAAALLETLERLLTAPFPAPVPLPAGGLLLLLTRILSMDDVVHSSGVADVNITWHSICADRLPTVSMLMRLTLVHNRMRT